MTNLMVFKTPNDASARPCSRSGRGRQSSILFLLFVLAWNPLALRAQSTQWRLDLNGSRLRYDTLEALNAPSAVTQLEWQGSKLLGRLGGSLTGFQDNGWSVQGRGDLAGWFSPVGVANPVRLELSGALGGSRHSSGFESYLGQGDARLHLMSGKMGAWLGMGMAVSENTFDSLPVQSVLPNLGAWVRIGAARLTVHYLDNRVEGYRYPEANGSAIYSRGPLDLTVFAGFRDSPLEGVESDSWAGGSLALWFRSDVAVLVSGGKYAPDLLQGIPGGDFFSVGLRLAPGRRRPPEVPSVPLPLMFTRESAREGEIAFTLLGAQTVQIAGDWNAWQPTPLSRDRQGRWVLPRDLPQGVHRFNLRVDGEEWVVPEGVPTLDDGFGGQVGILVISGG